MQSPLPTQKLTIKKHFFFNSTENFICQFAKGNNNVRLPNHGDGCGRRISLTLSPHTAVCNIHACKLRLLLRASSCRKTHFASVYIAHSCVKRQRAQCAFTKVENFCTICTFSIFRHFRERTLCTLSLHTAVCNIHACKVRLPIFATFLHGLGVLGRL